MIIESKTYDLITSLSEKEASSFREFLRSPFFNTNETLLLWFDYIRKADFSIDDQTKYKRIHNQSYNEKKLRYILSEINILIEKYFVVQTSISEYSFSKKSIIESLNKRKSQKHALAHQRELLNYIESTKQNDSDFLKTKFEIEELLFKYASEYDNRSVDSRLQNLSESLDTFYFAKKLKYSCEMINQQNVLQVKHTPLFINEIKFQIENSRLIETPAIAAYYRILNTLLEPENEDHYDKLKNTLQQNANAFSKQELKDMFTFAQNYCIRKLNSGETKYLSELFINYKYLIEHGIIISENTLSQFDFKNIITIALRLNEFDWVRQFIKDYIKLLPKGDAKNAEIYNTARLHYALKETRKAMQLMQTVEFTDIYYHLDAKVLLIKIYYDLNEVEALLPVLTNMNNYLRRNKKVSEYQRSTYLNFVLFVKKMFNYKMFEKGNITFIKQEIENTKAVADINWIKTKLTELN